MMACSLPVMWCRWKPRWSVVLSALGLGWVFATSVTAFGMYMIACNTSTSVTIFVNHHDKGQEEEDTPSLELHPPLVPRHQGIHGVGGGKVQHSGGGCTWRWSVGAGQLVLAAGSLLNILLLLLLLSFLILERRSREHPLPPDPPPDYETVMKEETPPPSFSDLVVITVPTPTPTPTPAATGPSTTPPQSSSLECLIVEEPCFPPPYTP